MAITLVPYHQDERLPEASFPCPATTSSGSPGTCPKCDVWTRLAALYEVVSAKVADQLTCGTAPSVVSGDCLIAEAVLAGKQRAGLDPSVIWFDAHGDVHSPGELHVRLHRRDAAAADRPPAHARSGFTRMNRGSATDTTG